MFRCGKIPVNLFQKDLLNRLQICYAGPFFIRILRCGKKESTHPLQLQWDRCHDASSGDLLSRAISKLGDVYQDRGDLIMKAWPEIIGPKLAAMTQVASFREGVLTVKVRNSTLHSLLSRHDKIRILTALQQRFPKTNIQNIVFRIG